MRLSHWHEFDPKAWKLVSRVQVSCRPHPLDPLTGVPQDTTPYPKGAIIVFSNTCTECGDLIFRRVKEIED